MTRAKDRRAEHKAYYAANREAILARNAAYRRRNKRKVKAARAAWRAANPGAIQRAAYKRYGYPTPTRPEPGRCECCGRIPATPLCLDHDHKTNKFRGWLCGSCNRAAGLLGDTLQGVKKLVVYLRRAA